MSSDTTGAEVPSIRVEHVVSDLPATASTWAHRASVRPRRHQAGL